ncbi:MAG: hemolysin III family protein [Clostridia bacterium]|nr:hemolysin III family protein [Clostridia bacterium]
MKRTKLEDRELPSYTKGEEIANMVTHIIGGVIGIVAIVLCSIFAKNAYGVISGVIFGVSMLILYTMSSIYHGLSPKVKGKKVLQILDHCTIFLLIAGSYTPFALCTLREYHTGMGWAIFGIIWAVAVLGMVLNSIDLKKYKIFSMICYLAMGWCIIVKINVLPTLLSMKGFSLLLAGGIVYTLGAICYIIGKKHKYIHTVFHICVLIASFLHFLCILLYVI